MGTLDVALIIFLAIVLVGGMVGFLVYNSKKED